MIIFIAAVIYPDPDKIYLEERLLGGELKLLPRIYGEPSLRFPLGTDQKGRDNLVVLMHGARNSFVLGFFVAIFCTLIATLIGAVGTFKGGILDEAFGLITNIFLVFPQIPFLILLASMVQQRSMFVVAIIIVLFSWPWAARSIRAQVLSLKERAFVKVSKITGIRGIKIAILEVLPNMLSYIMLVFAIMMSIGIGAEASISMLGLGQTTDITLGKMLYDSVQDSHVINGYIHLWAPPGIVLSMFIILFYSMHSSMVELFNPRLRKK